MKHSSFVVEGTFTSDYDIQNLHHHVINYLTEQEQQESFHIQEMIKTTQEKLNQTSLTFLQKKYYEKTIDELKKKMKDVETHYKIETYKSETSSLLELFLAAGGGHKKMCFGKPLVVTEEEKELIPYRLEIIRRYIPIVKKYMPIHLTEYFPNTMLCPVCKTDLSGTGIDENGIQICPKCSMERALPSKGFCSSTNATMEMSCHKGSRHDNEERENFMKARIRYTGRQKEKLPSDLFVKLDKYFKQNNLPTSEEIKAVKGTITRTSLYQALSAIGYPLYEHTNLILHKYIDTPLPDITHVDQLLDLHFDLTYKASQELGLEPINTQFRLFKQLEMVGENVQMIDFRVPKTRELLEIDEEHWRSQCDATGDYGKMMGVKYIRGI
jgi:hypothetical protein